MNQLSLVYPKYALGRSEVLSKQQGGLLVNCYKKTIAMVEIAIVEFFSGRFVIDQ